MIGFLTFLIVLIGLGFVMKLFNFSEYVQGNSLNISKVFKAVGVVIVALLIAWFIPIEAQRIDAGNIALKVDRIGNSKGIPAARPCKGLVFYNPWLTDVEETSIRQFHIKYGTFEVPAKGGTMIPVAPEYNLSLKPEMYVELYIHVLKGGQLESLKDSWLKTATINAMVFATNKFSPDSLFNNAQAYRIEVEKELEKQVGKYFIVDQVNAGQAPPESMRASLQRQAEAVLAAKQAQLDRTTAIAQAETKMATARGDSAKLVIEAAGEAEAIKYKTRELSPAYVEYIKWKDASPDLPRVPSTMLGTNTSVLYSPK